MSERSQLISRLVRNRATRESYIGAKLKVLIPCQIRALRLKSQTPRQEDLAKEAEMKQSRISAMETPGAVNFNLETLVRIASALKVGLIVKFASFSEMLAWENEFNQDTFNPITIDVDPTYSAEATLGPVPSLDITAEQTQELGLGPTQPVIIGAAAELVRRQLPA